MNEPIARGGSLIYYGRSISKRQKYEMSLFELILMSTALLYLFLLP